MKRSLSAHRSSRKFVWAPVSRVKFFMSTRISVFTAREVERSETEEGGGGLEF